MSATEQPNDVSNPEARQRMLESARQEVKQKRREQTENMSTKQWLQGQLDEQTRTVAVMGRDFDFRPLGTDAVADVLDYTPNSVPEDEDDLSGIDLAEMPGLLRKICGLLADACTDPEMDREAWGSVPPDVIERVFEDVAFPEEGLDRDEMERVEQFRNER